MPAASAAADPPPEPPGVRAGSHGLLVRPKIGFSVWRGSPSQDVTMVCPMRIAPAARSRAATVPSSSRPRPHGAALVRHGIERLGAHGRAQAGYVMSILEGHRDAVERAPDLA